MITYRTNDIFNITISRWDAHNDNDLYVCMRTAFISYFYMYIWYYITLLLCTNDEIKMFNHWFTLHLRAYLRASMKGGDHCKYDTKCAFKIDGNEAKSKWNFTANLIIALFCILCMQAGYMPIKYAYDFDMNCPFCLFVFFILFESHWSSFQVWEFFKF